MRRWLLIGLLFLGLGTAGAQETAVNHQSVTAYLQTLLEEPVGSITRQVDQLIDSVGRQQPELQSKVAGIAFDFFTSSPVMGHEAVAVHIADNWFLNNRLKLEDESLYPLLYTYAEFNRSSLVGKDAPALTMEDPLGIAVNVRDIPTDYKILFFYDTDCSTCRKEAPLLVELLKEYQGSSLTLVAIYTQSDREAWEAYATETFDGIDNPAVNVVHLWDPEAATGFHQKYAVLSTPMMFLLDNQNVILGRGLDCEALAQLLHLEGAQVLQYRNMFDRVFGTFNPITYSNVTGLVDAFAEKTRPNSKLYTEILFHLFNYLRTSEESAKQQGAIYLAENYIAAEPEFWSQEFLNRTVHALAQAKLNPVGERATNLTLQNKRGKPVQMLNGAHYYTLVFFHLLDCKQCQQEFEALRKLKASFYDLDIRVVMVYVGEDRDAWRKFVCKQWPSRWNFLNDFDKTSGMRELYDLEYVPHIYLMDETGIIIAKDIRAYELKELLPLL